VRLKKKFHKSEVYCHGEAKERSEQFEEILTCKVCTLPFKDLGLPVNEKRLKELTGILLEKKLGFYYGKNVNISGRTLLINTSLSNILLHMFSFYRIPVGNRRI
jgi:hypothetical protein